MANPSVPVAMLARLFNFTERRAEARHGRQTHHQITGNP
jgi:hypothetical protein